MKRLSYFNMLLLSSSILLLFSCKPKDVDSNEIMFVAAESNFWGNFYANNTTTYDLFLMDNQFKNSPVQNKSGIVIYFDLTGPTSNSTAIPAGTYRATTDRRAYTFHRGDLIRNNDNSYTASGSYFEVWRNGDIVDYWIITSGNLTVEKSGNYTISGVVTTGDNESKTFSYRGAIDNHDVTPWPTSLVKGEIVYEGRKTSEQYGDRNMFNIYLGGENANFNDFSGNSDILIIELYAPITLNNTIPSGTYTVEYNTQKAMTIMDGHTYKDANNNLLEGGTWYYTSKKFPITTGDMNVSVSGDYYILDYQFYTETGMKIAGTFKGSLSIFPGSASPAPASKAKPMQRVKSEQNRNTVRITTDSPRTRELSNSRRDNKRVIRRYNTHSIPMSAQ